MSNPSFALDPVVRFGYGPRLMSNLTVTKAKKAKSSRKITRPSAGVRLG